MEVNLDANWKVVDIAKKAGATVVLNPAPAREIPDEIMAKVDIITPNEIEAGELTGIEIKTYEDAAKAADVLIEKGVGEVIITLGEMGAYIKSGSRQQVVKRLNVDAVDTTGAGDAFNGGLVASLAEGMDIFDAARFANVVGALSVTKQGAAQAAPFRNQIDQFINNNGETNDISR
jgi:ribokinase